jgi:hypothetical protein
LVFKVCSKRKIAINQSERKQLSASPCHSPDNQDEKQTGGDDGADNPSSWSAVWVRVE